MASVEVVVLRVWASSEVRSIEPRRLARHMLFASHVHRGAGATQSPHDPCGAQGRCQPRAWPGPYWHLASALATHPPCPFGSARECIRPSSPGEARACECRGRGQLAHHRPISPRLSACLEGHALVEPRSWQIRHGACGQSNKGFKLQCLVNARTRRSGL